MGKCEIQLKKGLLGNNCTPALYCCSSLYLATIYCGQTAFPGSPFYKQSNQNIN